MASNSNAFKLPYARHYNPRFVYFLPTFWRPKTFFQGGFFINFWPIFKSGNTLLKNCADTSITGWKMAVPNVTLECHPHVCCSQQGETVWMMEKYASTYRQEMGWCLRILSSKIIHCSKGIGSKNEQTDRHYNLLFRCISQIASLFRKKENILFHFSLVARLQN